jgi:ribosomal protein S15P/S13E
LLTERINSLAGHFKSHVKDFHSCGARMRTSTARSSSGSVCASNSH